VSYLFSTVALPLLHEDVAGLGVDRDRIRDEKYANSRKQIRATNCHPLGHVKKEGEIKIDVAGNLFS
jgi:hypothetical protein